MNNQEKYKVGDYIIAKDNSVYRIIDTYDDTIHRLYDIKGLHKLENVQKSDLDDPNLDNTVLYYKCLTADILQNFGKVVAEEDAGELMSILFTK